MKRRDMVRGLLAPEATDTSEPPLVHMPRVPSQAVRAMGLEIGRLAAEANEANALRAQIQGGTAIIDLDPALIDPSFVADRLAPTEDAEYRRLVDSIRQSGQQAPILVRPHPNEPGRYQVAYGHRRRHAAAELGRPVRAVIRALDDAELVVAQGQENAERRNLSFIERALFAAHLEARGFDRRTLTAALGVHTTEMTRLLAVAAVVPRAVIHAIGPAPKAGRPRWLELASLLANPALATLAATVMEQASFRQAGSDARFEILLAALRDDHAKDAGETTTVETLRDSADTPVIRIEHTRHGVRIAVNERAAPGLSAFLVGELPELLRRFQDTADPDAA
jgi:ParB family transcriptional regulator, chromosome partitioning protein